MTESDHIQKYCNGKALWKTWLASKGLLEEKQLDNSFKPSDKVGSLRLSG